jgi:hypothetical protein
MTMAAARARGMRVDEHIAQTQLQRTAAYLEENRERALENVGPVDLRGRDQLGCDGVDHCCAVTVYSCVGAQVRSHRPTAAGHPPHSSHHGVTPR